jgi:asparagine N-glycosylation enzyme membrane subunit Stt3
MLGTSGLLDFLACAGLGIAGVSTLAVVFYLTRRLGMTSWPVFLRNLCSILVLVAALGAQMALAAFIGATKSVRTEDSILGFAIGAVVFGGLLLLVLARTVGRRSGDDAADEGTTGVG